MKTLREGAGFSASMIFSPNACAGFFFQRRDFCRCPSEVGPPRFGPTVPNPLANMDPRGVKSASGFGPPFADFDTPLQLT